MSEFEQDLLARVCKEAAELSKTERVAAVYRLPRGRLIASSANKHMITGKMIARFLDGKETTI